MKTLFKSNRFINYDFAISKKLNRVHFIIFTSPFLFWSIKAR